MTDHGSGPVPISLNGTHYPPKPCPPSAPCHAPAPDRAAEPKPYQRDQLSNAEAAVLTKAKTDAETDVVNAGPGINALESTLQHRENEALTALLTLELFVNAERLASAASELRRVQRRHRNDGPEDRRRRPSWVRWALWLSLPAASIYDTAFFATVFLKLVDNNFTVTNPMSYIALLPGVVITVALLVTGHWVAEAIARARAHVERTPQRVRFRSRLAGWLSRRPPTAQTREPDSLPWPRWALPIGFGFLIISTLAIWAINRAHDATTGGQASTPALAVALLLLMFSLTAIAIKVVHHNPFADSMRAAERELSATTQCQQETVTAATTAVGDFATVNRQLHDLLDDVEFRAWRHFDQAWSHILEQRHAHGLAGNVAPPFAQGATGAGRHPLLVGIVEPEARAELVHSARKSLRDAQVTAARERLERLLARLAKQLTGAPDPTKPAPVS